jgi:membrane-bound ClpP family serine protease
MNDPDERSDDPVAVPGLTPSAGFRVLRAIRVPGVLLLIGFALTVVGPFPGLGAFLVIGAALLTFVIGMTALVGR